MAWDPDLKDFLTPEPTYRDLERKVESLQDELSKARVEITSLKAKIKKWQDK